MAASNSLSPLQKTTSLPTLTKKTNHRSSEEDDDKESIGTKKLFVTTNIPHNWREKTFNTPTFCDFCSGKLHFTL